MKPLIRALHRVIASSELSQKLLDLAADIISLNYDASTEKKLLDLVEKAYTDIKVGATADAGWESAIRKNKEKKDELKKSRQKQNLDVLRRAQKHGKMAQDDSDDEDFSGDGVPDPIKEAKKTRETKETRERIKEKIGNVITVNFGPKRNAQDDYVADETSRIERVRQSLIKIDNLMKELKK